MQRASKRKASSKSGKPVYFKKAPTRKEMNKVAVSGYPARMRCKFRYASEFSLTAGAGYAYRQYSCNSLFDPDRTGVGHQPIGFDEMMAGYDHYTVVKSKITVRPIQGTSNTQPVYFGILRQDTTGDPTFASGEHFLESPLVGRKVFFSGSIYEASADKLEITKYFDAKKEFGCTDPMDRKDIQGSASANPTEESFFTIVAHTVNGQIGTAQAYVAIIDYEAILSEPKLLGQS